MSTWETRRPPERRPLVGRYARLEPLDPAGHGADLYQSARQPGADERFRYLFETPPPDRETFGRWLDRSAMFSDPLFFAVIDQATGRAEGRQSLMRIEPAHGVIEVGHILWGPAIARTRVTTEALFLVAVYVFEELGYRRLEWKCDSRNGPSRRAAERFGFVPEGIFRQHMMVKDRSRDTAWFAIIDADWPRLKAGYSRWLAPDNFDAAGAQRSKLTF